MIKILTVLSFVVFVFSATPAEASQKYYNNFDGQSTGTLPTGFANIGSSSVQVDTNSPITGLHSVKDNNNTDGDISLLTSVPSQTNMSAQLSQVVHFTDGSNWGGWALILQSDASAQNYYMLFPHTPSGNIYLYKHTTAGGLVQVGSPINHTFRDGERFILKADVNAGVVSIKIWSPHDVEPVASSTITDSSPLVNAGYAGVRFSTLGISPTVPTFDDFFMGDNNTTFDSIGVDGETLKWQNRTNILSPQGSGFEKYLVLEPTKPIWDGSQWVSFYTGLDRTNSAIGRMTSPDLVNWTRYSGNPVMGLGSGGESGFANEPAAVLKNGIWYLYYSNGYGNGSDGKVATSTDGINFSSPQVIISHSAQPWFNNVANKGILIDDDGIWKMLFEGGSNNGTMFKTGLATSTDGLTWTLDPSSNPLNSLEIGTGMFGGTRSLYKIQGIYNVWYHTSYTSALPCDISHAVSTDLKNWTVLSGNPIFYRQGETLLGGVLLDQVADPAIIESGGKTYMFYDVDQNIGFNGNNARIDMATYNGTLQDLAARFNVTGPLSGDINQTSTDFTVNLSEPASGSETITITSSNGSDIITPSIGSPGTGTVIVTPVNGATSFTFTYTPSSSSGARTITFANAQGWVNPTDLNYTANAVVPGAPTIGTATAGNAQATVTFTAPASNGGATITGYTVTSIPSGGTDSNAGTTGLSHVVTGLTNGTSYTFTVKATNSAGNSAESSASGSVTPATVPGAPTGATATTGNTQATITFTAPASNGGATITGYTVTSIPAGGTDSNGGSTGLSHVVTGLTNGTSYTFTVHATNSAGDSAESTQSNSVTPKTVPGAPTGATATGGNAQATITFTAPASNGGATITGYTVSSIPSFGSDTNAGSTSLSHLFTGIANGVPYTFTVHATNSAGDSAESAPSNSVTPAASHSLSGTIKYYDGIKLVPSATVTLEDGSSNPITSTTTDVNGVYSFSNVADGGNYIVVASKTDGNGAENSADQIKIGRHIVGLETFDTIYKNISADVNNDGTLSSADQIKIGRNIVGLDVNLPSGAWKFYASNVTPTTGNYLFTGLSRTYTNLTADQTNQDFVGIKMGDTNNSW